jgi:hypothetical protein
MKKKINVFCMWLFLGIGVFAQSIIDPSDRLYSDILVWDTLGLVSNLPPLRPYPEQVVKSILNRVMENGSASEQEKARIHYERLFGKIIRVGTKGGGSFQLDSHNEKDAQVDLSLIALGSTALPHLDLVSISYDVNVLVSNKVPGEEIVPANSAYQYDTYNDTANIGSFNLFADINTTLALGTEKLWFQAGLSRYSWGDFYDNGVVIGPQAAHAGNASVIINQEKWTYSLGLFMLSASSDNGDMPYPGKFMAIHSIGFAPFPWLELTYYESSIYGNRFEPVYLLPVSPYMVSQEFIGFAEDNIQMGLSWKIKPFRGFSWASNVFLDDIGFNDLAQGQFDTKLRMAVQTGVIWAPPVPAVSSVSLDYTLITPYTYTHFDNPAGKPNYQNYTNNGRSLGAAIPPNSDRLTLKGNFEPLKDLQLQSSVVFIRHANVNESLPAEYAKEYLYTANENYVTNSNGGITDSPDAGGGYFDIAHHKLFFMEQETKQYTTQLGIGAEWRLPGIKIGALSLTAGYTFEYIFNDGIDAQMFTGREFDSKTDLDNASHDEIEKAISAARKKWRDGVRNTINNYVFLGIKYVF